MGDPVLVTGASGNVGALVLAGLRETGVPVRAADIAPGRVRARFPGVPTGRPPLGFAQWAHQQRDTWARP